MKRDKQWWQNLSPQERSQIVQLERANNDRSRGFNIPDDMSECGYCGTPHMSYGLCPHCDQDLEKLINKANDIRSINTERYETRISNSI
jgi:hypothetical protein